MNIEQLVLFDTGTTYTRLPKPVYDSLLKVVRRHTTEREEGNDSSWFVGIWIIIMDKKKRKKCQKI